ncbi:hypothetical protein ACRAWF_38855 [Streptomyces sp. L7]
MRRLPRQQRAQRVLHEPGQAVAVRVDAAPGQLPLQGQRPRRGHQRAFRCGGFGGRDRQRELQGRTGRPQGVAPAQPAAARLDHVPDRDGQPGLGRRTEGLLDGTDRVAGDGARKCQQRQYVPRGTPPAARSPRPAAVPPGRRRSPRARHGRRRR